MFSPAIRSNLPSNSSSVTMTPSGWNHGDRQQIVVNHNLMDAVICCFRKCTKNFISACRFDRKVSTSLSPGFTPRHHNCAKRSICRQYRFVLLLFRRKRNHPEFFPFQCAVHTLHTFKLCNNKLIVRRRIKVVLPACSGMQYAVTAWVTFVSAQCQTSMSNLKDLLKGISSIICMRF